ncbi:MAG: GDSL-type esterase/lipase family protein [Planctomycetota bacterium]|nr:GDSL-type esterase/lipase family protein [Planctomycetota bacterium]
MLSKSMVRFVCFCWIGSLGQALGLCQVPTELELNSPRPFEVIQRRGFVPKSSHLNRAGGATRGFGDVRVSMIPPKVQFTQLQVRYLDWNLGEAKEFPLDASRWQSMEAIQLDGKVQGTIRLPAGGWYRLEVRLFDRDSVVAQGQVGPFGIGELFLVAGQSYATNSNDQHMRVEDSSGRVVAYDCTQKSWRIAHDPQPISNGGDGGSIWPVVGDLLIPVAQVPIGFANVAVGGTSSTQWLPEGSLFPRLIEAGKELGDFRAVLWQQGESDVIEKATSETYRDRMIRIRDTAASAWGKSPDWLLAKSTLHPTVYNEPLNEHRIRVAIDELISSHGFETGPDTDILGGENRGGIGTRRHFSEKGQRHAALMWFATLWNYVNRERPNHEAVFASLPSLHLLEPAWNSSVIYRESSILMQEDDAEYVTARLAFPAAEIIEVQSADGRHRFQSGKDFSLLDDKLTLMFRLPTVIEPLRSSQLFPPKDSPNSYRHRKDHPEQNLLYAPGRWFHDRDLEITYRRVSVDATPNLSADSKNLLQKTKTLLRSGKGLKIAVSGDSISTGLDASGTTQAFPNQPGYPDLVAAQLQDSNRCAISLVNRSVAGWSVANGVADLAALLASKPDLLIVAYGMNDVGRKDPVWYGQQTKLILDQAKASCPEIEIILVATMLGNSEWIHTPREMFSLYRDQLRELSGPDVALADLTEVWTKLLIHKHDLDLTGNGLNHPNDFGHRLYAQAILQLLGDPK